MPFEGQMPVRFRSDCRHRRADWQGFQKAIGKRVCLAGHRFCAISIPIVLATVLGYSAESVENTLLPQPKRIRLMKTFTTSADLVCDIACRITRSTCMDSAGRDESRSSHCHYHKLNFLNAFSVILPKKALFFNHCISGRRLPRRLEVNSIGVVVKASMSRITASP